MPFHTIGIIGGADSPTEIFLSGKRSVWELAAQCHFCRRDHWHYSFYQE